MGRIQRIGGGPESLQTDTVPRHMRPSKFNNMTLNNRGLIARSWLALKRSQNEAGASAVHQISKGPQKGPQVTQCDDRQPRKGTFMHMEPFRKSGILTYWQAIGVP